MRRSTLVAFQVAGLALCFSGCVLSNSTHPLSDAKTSIVDDRLVGTWLAPQPRDRAAPAGKAEDEPSVFRVTRSLDDAPSYVGVRINSEEYQHDKLYASCTKFGDKHFLSVTTEKTLADKKESYILVHYAFHGDDEIHWFILPSKRLIKAIQDQEIAGIAEYKERVTGTDASGGATLTKPLLTASTEELRAYFANAGAALVAADEPYAIWRRVKQ